MQNRIMRAARLLLCAAAAHVPVSAAAAGWDVTKASSNFELVALSDAELSARSIGVIHIGNVELPSGRIVAADPLAQPDRPALARTVAPGDYPVTLYKAFGRIAAAGMRFAEGRPDHWELAVLPGQDVATLKDGEVFGYPVDAGLGCYMDADTLDLIGEREAQAQAQKPDADINYYDDVLAADLDANKGAYALHRPVAGKRGNVALFWSGWGDGFYPVFWGLDKDGRALVLLTDFSVVENADGPKEPKLQ
ncbi:MULTISPECIES: DUF4241 domain-containing protein [unclassified Rhizobium]|uniref:DUF4241 domain-containing protein n=1 Tax=unclassified Rhizobium TaxID=2613769 RepID=UPI0007EA720B|nr:MULTISPECIES: DUF4241 domain-containing protein [unclassified Rhizobium]ANM12575.1 hypothetical protein AMK05_CH04250 [Rhizobium sp. N324]ANM18978.1 hypothetical protein AMK06_CH04137 [Rhizobium sp. N541]ANM25363.1 hypothetical protein AMK07_CH04133 [Rhizobium sp. N941]OYD01750.1 hypothetical protein AMK08_CH200154 [Rhizobium sp. N4311]